MSHRAPKTSVNEDSPDRIPNNTKTVESKKMLNEKKSFSWFFVAQLFVCGLQS